MSEIIHNQKESMAMIKIELDHKEMRISELEQQINEINFKKESYDTT